MPNSTTEELLLETVTAVDAKPRNRSEHSIALSPRRICRILTICMVALLFAHIAAIVIHDGFDQHLTLRKILLQYFNFDKEGNFPTYFSALLLLASSLICFYISASDKSQGLRKKSKYWLGLGIIFMILSLDEAVQIHEQFMIIMDYLIPQRASIFSSAWTIPYMAIVAVVGFYFLRFVMSLPNPVRNLVILSGSIFVGGAIGVEFLEGYFEHKYGHYHFTSHAAYTLQELMEMSGVILFIYTLLTYISHNRKKVILKFKM